MQLELANLTNEQLNALTKAGIEPTLIREELARREAFPDMPTAFNELRAAQVRLETVVEGFRRGPVTNAIHESGIVAVLARFMATAKLNGITFENPTLNG